MAHTPSHFPLRPMISWSLVALVFAGLIIFWIPSFFQTIKQLSQEVGKSAHASSEDFNSQWGVTQQQINQVGEMISLAVTNKNILSKEQIETFIKEVEAQTATLESKDPVAFPVHEDILDTSFTETDPARAYCTRNGGQAVTREQKIQGYDVCIFKDGSECEVGMFVEGSCRLGQYKKAEDGMKKIPDLVLEVKKSGYCTTRTVPTQWTEDKDATYICLDGVTIKNIGWSDASSSAIRTAGKYYDIPSIPAGESFTFSDMFPFIQAMVNNQAVIVVDAKNNVEESNEHNNIYSFPQ
ncbi:MAG: DUF333 domain-containing protein [bacterium]|nr:DUF333 domain-containing protein [bacterium]